MAWKSSEQSSQKPAYTWLNQEQYKDESLHESVNKLRYKLSDQQEVATVGESFQKIMKKSSLAIVQLNQENKTLRLFDLPDNHLVGKVNNHEISLNQYFSGSKQKHKYRFGLAKYLNGQGTTFNTRVSGQKQKFGYGLIYEKIMSERIDNHFCSNKDKVGIYFHNARTHKYFDAIGLTLARENRENYLSFDGRGKNEDIFGLNQAEQNRLKQTKLWSLKLGYQYSILSAFLRFGFDYGNKSLFTEVNLKLQKYIDLNKSVGINMQVQASEVYGKNILKNDYLFKNKKYWSGKTTNFLRPRLEIIFKQYPYVSFFTIYPYIYCETCHYYGFLRNGERTFNNELDYGIGLMMNNSKIDISLLTMSRQKEGDRFGMIKFSF